jgi:hypothetical protein
MANVVERNRGLYASYAARLSDASALTMAVTLYVAPVLSNDPREEMGMYLPLQVLV